MSLLSRFFGKGVVKLDTQRLAFVDVEVGVKDRKIHDIGALRADGAVFHRADRKGLLSFIRDVHFVCGHNIIHHDAHYLFGKDGCCWQLVDTLYMSPLLFPDRPYHHLVKDDKLLTDQVNNPVNDCEKARSLLSDELACWHALPIWKQRLFSSLLWSVTEFDGFLRLAGVEGKDNDVVSLVRQHYAGKICENANIAELASRYPCGLAYALALIDTQDPCSITPGWVLYHYPEVERIVRLLRQTPCDRGCPYCCSKLDVAKGLKTFFGYNEFRTYEGEPLQERAARAALMGKSLLAIFPTGGGKSLTFQLPALMAGQAVRGLTVVISPLQSLMKDQVDNLVERGITDAVFINGMLDPITRAEAISRVQNGYASLLYISPEMLRSKTIEHVLTARHVVRFVIDEAHCFSAWGQDFRVDYLYIGKFIREYQQQKNLKTPIPVSCFTATAKQKVIQDIRDYFRQTLNLNLEMFASTASRTNLNYTVIHVEDENEKYLRLRELVSESDSPTIVYVSRTKRTRELAEKLTRDGFRALPFNGQMQPDEKVANQEAFMNDRVRVVVATSAFGMGVDKSDVGMVIHYDISDSLENYVQEAGRAGRDPRLSAQCFVLYRDGDLDKHFILLNQTKLSISEINQVWSAVKSFTKQRPVVNCSALEIARQAGWDDSVSDIETRVRTALAALEQSGYLERGSNVPHVYATGITVRNMDEARTRLTQSKLFEAREVENAARVINSLISQKYIAKAQDSEAESRVDYLADILGLKKKEVVSVVERMRQEGILADTQDISAYLLDSGETERKSMKMLERFAKLERFILEQIPDDSLVISYKQLNENAVHNGMSLSKEKDIRTLLYFLTIKGYTKKWEDSGKNLTLRRLNDLEQTVNRFERRLRICHFAVEWLYGLAQQAEKEPDSGSAIQFSVVALLKEIQSSNLNLSDILLEDVEEALLYMSKIGALKLDGGFFVLYNTMSIKRVKDSALKYKQADYRTLNEFYRQKIQQIHIIGEYANLMVKDYEAALQYVRDYFQMDYKVFVLKYFDEKRQMEIERNLSPGKYNQLFGQLSGRQLEVISDKSSRCLVVTAGPGSGKTRVLVHKLASLLLLEDVKHEQLLMLTFSRAAATEFKMRLMKLIGNAAHFVEVKTFHAYCFDLLCRMGNLDEIDDVVSRAVEMINLGEVEPNRIGKMVLVVDEAQDMGASEYGLVKALMARNEEMRVIAVGDDDQNIYAFRGSDSSYMYRLSQEPSGKLVEMTENYRSSRQVVDFANAFLASIHNRMKKSPIVSMSKEDGRVEVTLHQSSFLYQPVVDDVIHHATGGTSCVLTETNEEALTLTALLRRCGVKCKLVQSMSGLRFWNIAEMRFFLKYVDKRIQTPVISEELWTEAKSVTNQRYLGSTALEYLNRCLSQFEKTAKDKYLTDFKNFVFESYVEDFCDVAGIDVVVSTIHKVKGKEFDNVFMLIHERHVKDDALMRCRYVGITRAKKKLFIHTNDYGLESNIGVCRTDSRQYDMPGEVVLQLTHKDVNLGFFIDKKKKVLALQGGSPLLCHDGYILSQDTNQCVGQLSRDMRHRLQEWVEKGYRVKCALVRFVVAWKPKDASKDVSETAVLLADITLSSCLTSNR